MTEWQSTLLCLTSAAAGTLGLAKDSQKEPSLRPPPDNAKLCVSNWAKSHRQAVLYDNDSSVLLDVASGKRLKIAWPALASYEEKVHPETKDNYLVLLFDDGTQLALVDPGGVA